MRLRLASRQSDLARWQAVQVARRLEALPARPSVEFLFKASLGDQNLDLPLAQMGSKGVFTEDFYEDLLKARCDLVVHSWKDLPTEERAGTRIALTLPRADVRDVLMVPRGAWMRARDAGHLTVLTSSPRRVYNLGAALPNLLPGSPDLTFENVRGNVPTRLRKMHEAGAALVLAKAGLDRLLEAEDENFLTAGVSVRTLIKDCLFMVLPVSLNPPAPAQGALAIEIPREAPELAALCDALNDPVTFDSVARERAVLRAHGGGCHQKIGVAVLPRAFGTVHALRGLTEAGVVLSEWRIANDTPWTRARDRAHVFPTAAGDNTWFERRPVEPARDPGAEPGLFVARAEALPASVRSRDDQLMWTAGVRSWSRLAKRGFWVSGCQDGLGEFEPLLLERMVPGAVLTKLTHAGAAGPGELATYRLEPKADGPDLRGKTHFFWMSGTSFERARELWPEPIAAGHHACGPGRTHEFLCAQTGLRNPPKVFVGLDHFLSET